MAVGETAPLGAAAADHRGTPAIVALVGLEIRDDVCAALAGSRFTLGREAERVEELLAAKAAADLVIARCETGERNRLSELTVLAELVGVPVVAVVVGTERSAARRALGAGAIGVVRACSLDATLVPCLEAVASGQACIPADKVDDLDRPVLSHREKQVLGHAARGLTNFEIGARLFLSEHTVKSHLSAAFRKLGVRSRAEAAAVVLDPVTAVELGMGVGYDAG